MINIYVRELDTTWIGLAHTEEKIVATALSQDKETTLKSLLRSLPPNADYQIVNKASDFAEKTILALREVHLGGQPFADFTLATEYVPEPLASVLRIAASIPVGYVATYGNMAKTAGTEPQNGRTNHGVKSTLPYSAVPSSRRRRLFTCWLRRKKKHPSPQSQTGPIEQRTQRISISERNLSQRNETHSTPSRMRNRKSQETRAQPNR